MKQWILIPVALVSAVIGGAVAASMFSAGEGAANGTREAQAEDVELAVRLDRLSEAIAAQDERQRALAEAVEEVRMRPSTAPIRSAVDDIDAAIERWIRDNAAGAERLAETAGSARPMVAGDGLAPEATLEEIMDALMALDSAWNDDDLWQELRDSGRIGDVVAEYERMAAEDPSNPDLQVSLGTAYIQELFGVGNSPKAGELATKADEAYDRALELDPSHWEGRFSKAVALSNWPAFLGKAGEAIAQFEMLVDQQSRMESAPNHAQTYLFLGNMYQQTGKSDQAIAMWREGLALFPDNRALAQQVQVNDR